MRVEVELLLRYAMFVNGILSNSEAWYSIIKKIEKNLKKWIEIFYAIF